MGNKSVCLKCRKSFSQGTDFRDRHESNCPDCGGVLTMLSHRFRPPKKTESKKWKAIQYLIDHGFRFQRVYANVDQKHDGTMTYSNIVPYPESLRDAKAFVEQFKDQAIK